MTRGNLGHTEMVALKLHPELLAYLHERAKAEYCTVQEYVRRLVIADMRAQS